MFSKTQNHENITLAHTTRHLLATGVTHIVPLSCYMVDTAAIQIGRNSCGWHICLYSRLVYAAGPGLVVSLFF